MSENTIPYDPTTGAARKATRDMRPRILEAAKAVFLERGFAEASMGDIAARAQVTRPTLHYYFHTKDGIFQTAMEAIIGEILPRVGEIVAAHDLPLAERVGGVVDAYYDTFRHNPTLPLFVIREIDRDADFFTGFLTRSPLRDTFRAIADSLREDMARGRLRPVPLPALFCSFYGALIFPFLVRNLFGRVSGWHESFDEALRRWRPYAVAQLLRLLRPDAAAPQPAPVATPTGGLERVENEIKDIEI